MRRQDKYPNTDVFQFYNANPWGRYTDDCVVRALSLALQQSWGQTFNDLCEITLTCGCMPTTDTCIDRYLRKQGWIKHPQPRKFDNTKYTGREFIHEILGSNRPYSNVVAKIGSHHIVAIVGGKIHDTWDSSNGCIGNYWTRY